MLRQQCLRRGDNGCRDEERREETAQEPGQKSTYVRGKKELKGKGAKARDG